MKSLYNILFFVFIISIGAFKTALGQPQNLIDSLQTIIKTSANDTNKVDNLNLIGWEYFIKGNYKDALLYSNEALDLAQKIVMPGGIGGFKKGKGAALNDLGLIYMYTGNYPKALDHFLKSLKIAEELSNKRGMTFVLNNIGVIYKEQSETEKALRYFIKALKINEDAGNNRGIAEDLGNIGTIYVDLGEYEKALDYFFRVKKIVDGSDNTDNKSIVLGNIGGAYFHLNNFEKAFENYSEALKQDEANGNKMGAAIRYSDLALLFSAQKKFGDAEKYLNKALGIDTIIGYLDHTKTTYLQLSELCYQTRRQKLALDYYKKYISVRDTLLNEENTKKMVQAEMNFDFDKKTATAKTEQDKKDLVSSEEKQKQKIIILSVSLGLVLVIILTIVIFRSLRQNQKKNKIITYQKELVEHQKELVDEKQKEILDSIYYARRIQRALITNEKYIEKLLNKMNNKNV